MLFPLNSQPIDWKPATLSENVLQRFSDNLRKVTVRNPYEKTSALESFFNEFAGINSKLASLLKKSSHQRHVPVNISELSVLLQEGLT